MRYKIIIAYDGSDYYGWQRQPNKITVQQAIEDSFFKVFSQKIKLLAASRTDSGVHAENQIAAFSTSLTFPKEQILYAWNNILPKEIIIKKIEKVAENYNPQVNVLEKTYIYKIFNCNKNPFLVRYALFIKKDINIILLKEALNLFVGVNDLRSFYTGNAAKTSIVKINSICVKYIKKNNLYKIIFKAKGFLHFMIRRILGACLAVSFEEQYKINELIKVIAAKNPNHTFPKIAANGLILYKIKYKGL